MICKASVACFADAGVRRWVCFSTIAFLRPLEAAFRDLDFGGADDIAVLVNPMAKSAICFKRSASFGRGRCRTSVRDHYSLAKSASTYDGLEPSSKSLGAGRSIFAWQLLGSLDFRES